MILVVKRIEIITSWIEQHPDVKEKIQEKLVSLDSTYSKVRNSIRGMGLDEKQQTAMIEGANQARDKDRESLIRQDREANALMKSYDQFNKVFESGSERMKRWGKSIGRVGYRIGWLSFRLVIMGRLLTQQMVKPIQWMIRELGNWEQSITKMVTGLAMLQASGLGASDALMELMSPESIRGLVESGMMIEGAMGALYAVFMSIASELAPIVAPAIVAVADALLALWQENKDELLPMLQALVDDLLPPLLRLITELGPVLISSFVTGMGYAIKGVVFIVDALTPFLPLIAGIIGFLLPFAPLLMLAGTAMFFLSPLLTTIAMVFGVLSGFLPAVGGGLTVVAGGVKAVGLAATASLGGLGMLSIALIAVSIAVWSIVAAVAFFTGQWEMFTGGIADVVDSIAGLVHGVQDAGSEIDALNNKVVTPQIHPGYETGDYETGYGGAGFEEQTNYIDTININIDNVENIEDIGTAIEEVPIKTTRSISARFR